MAVRALILNNLRWKLTAWLLAMLVWFAIKFAIYKGLSGHSQLLRHQPVAVLKAPNDSRLFHVFPPDVDVVVQAKKELHSGELEVFVNVTTMPLEIDSAYRPVLVHGNDVTNVVSVRESWVRVERFTPADSTTNSPAKP